MPKHMREINIRQVLNGFVVGVGCQTVVFTDIDTLCHQLKEYSIAPSEVEKKFGWDDRQGECVPQPTAQQSSTTWATAPLPYERFAEAAERPY